MPENAESKDADREDARIYELGYLLVPTIPEENIPAQYSALKDLITNFSGEIIADEVPKKIPLAYVMEKVISNVRNKFNSGYFGWVKFAMDAEKVLELKKKLDVSGELLRFLLIKTVKENTVAARRFAQRDFTRKPYTRKKEEKDATPINKEEIDKEIEAMVATEEVAK